MSKAEKFIEDYTRMCSNIEYTQGIYTPSYHPWLTPYQARRAVEIAREEIYEWLRAHSEEYVYWIKDDLINGLKAAMKDE